MVQITLYHYTTLHGATEIQKDKRVKASTDATLKKYKRHGKGVYFTSLGPENKPEDLVLNNFTKKARKPLDSGCKLFQKIRYVVRITFEKNDVTKVVDGVRDIYLHTGDIDLTKYQGRYKIYKNPNYQ